MCLSSAQFSSVQLPGDLPQWFINITDCSGSGQEISPKQPFLLKLVVVTLGDIFQPLIHRGGSGFTMPCLKIRSISNIRLTLPNKEACFSEVCWQ